MGDAKTGASSGISTGLSVSASPNLQEYRCTVGIGAEDRILAERGDRSIVASIKSHGTGRDGLQRFFCEQLVQTRRPADRTGSNYSVGLHRMGQPRDEVVTLAYRHTPEYADAIDNAIKQARWVQGVGGNLQKLCTASVIFLTP